jgi:hypothetical protein
MSNRIFKKILMVSIFTLIISITFITNIYAASFSVTTVSTIQKGNSATITVTGDVIGKFNVSSSNSNIVSVSASSIWLEGSVNIVLTANNYGSANITVTPVDVSDKDGIAYNGSLKTFSVNVPTPVVPPAPAPTPAPSTNNNTTTTKSSNNYLSSLSVNTEGLTPNFSKTKTSYTLTVKESVNDIIINAVAEDKKASINIAGNKGLIVGDNTVTITVTAENGTKRLYKIIVTKTNNPELSDSSLENLIIENITLTPDFSADVLEYDAGQIESKIEKLNFFVYTKNKNAKYEIIGNENLKSGENLIKVVVTSEDGKSTKEYLIKVIKKEAATIVSDIQTNSLLDSNNFGFKAFLKKCYSFFITNGLLILLLTLCIVEYIQLVYMYRKLNKYKKNEDVSKDVDSKMKINNKDNSFNRRRKVEENFPKEMIEDESTEFFKDN